MLTKNEHKCLSPNPDFIYDEACLDVVNNLDENVTIYYQYEECYKCENEIIAFLQPHQNTSVLINSTYSLNLSYVANEAKTECW